MPRVEHWPTTRATLLDDLRDPEDAQAWRQFVDLYLPLIYRYSRQRGLQDADAQNVVQEVFSLVSRAVQSFDYDPARGRFRDWLGLITHQRILGLLSKERPATCGIGNGFGDALADEMAFEVDGEWIEAFQAHVYAYARERVRAEFDADTWRVFEQVWEQGERPAEVARQMGRKPDWIYQAKFKVLQRVKQEVMRLSDDGIAFHRQR